MRVGGGGLDGSGHTRRCGASTTEVTSGGSVSRVGRVEPEHVDGIVVPKTEDQNHTSRQCISHSAQSTFGVEGVSVSEGGLLLLAECSVDFVGSGDSGDVGLRVLDDHSVLDVQPTNGGKSTGGLVIRRDKLGDDCERLSGVYCHSRAVESGVAEAVRVEITSGLVANSRSRVGRRASGTST